MLPFTKSVSSAHRPPVELGSLQKGLLAIGALNALLDSDILTSIATDEHGVIQLFSLGAERMLGYSSGEVLNRLTLAEIAEPREVEGLARSLSLAGTMASFVAASLKAVRGIQDRSELRFIRKDGSAVVAMVSVMVLLDDHGKVLGHSLMGAEQSAPPFKARAPLEENLGALITIDTNGIITDINEEMESLTGCTREEVIGGPFKNWFTEPDRAEADLAVVLRDKTVRELTARGKNGERTVSLRASPFHDHRRALEGAVARLR